MYSHFQQCQFGVSEPAEMVLVSFCVTRKGFVSLEYLSDFK